MYIRRILKGKNRIIEEEEEEEVMIMMMTTAMQVDMEKK